MVELGYGFAYRVLDAQFIRVDGYARAVPQRRRRVLVVGHLGDWRRAAAVLFERACLSGNPAPRREAGEGVAGTLSSSLDRCGTEQDARSGNLIAFGGNNTEGAIEVATACRAKGGSGHGDFESETFVAHALRGEGFDASEDGTGRGIPLVPIAFDTTQITSGDNRSNPQPGDPCHPIPAHGHAPAIALARGCEVGNRSAQETWRVRRLIPVECERLQGFPDGYTDVPYRRRNATPDGPRYKALGNSKAVNFVRWAGMRIAEVDAMGRAAA